MLWRNLIVKLCKEATRIKRAKQQKGKKAAFGDAPSSLTFDYDASGMGNSILSFSDATIESTADLETFEISGSGAMVGARAVRAAWSSRIRSSAARSSTR